MLISKGVLIDDEPCVALRDHVEAGGGSSKGLPCLGRTVILEVDRRYKGVSETAPELPRKDRLVKGRGRASQSGGNTGLSEYEKQENRS